MEARFSLDLNALADRVKDRMDDVVRAVLLQVGTNLVMRSPVGDPASWQSKPPAGYVGGRFRANWQYGFNVPATGQLNAVDAAGNSTVTDLSERVRVSGTSGIHYFSNNLPYAHSLEYGHSGQAPNGMIGITVIEFEDYVQRAAMQAKVTQ